MTDNILYHLPPQQQAYKPVSNAPPRGYEQQYQNPKYYKGNDWKTMNDPQNEQQSDTNSNLNYLQKEFLKGEYSRQQGEQQRKKDEMLRQKENDLQLQQQLKKEYDDDVLREKQQQAEKKRALAELYKAQIEQSLRDKASKKQHQIEEDRYRLMQQDDGKKDINGGRYVKEELRRDMVGQQYQADQRIKQELNRYQDQNVQPQFEIGGENYQKRQQMEKYERIQNMNARNFVSYDDEKKRKADTFSQAGSVNAPYGGVQNKQYSNNNDMQYYEKNNEKREYNELLKRQMAENEQKKQQEKYDRLRGYEFEQPSNQNNNRQQVSQQQQQQQRPKQSNDQEYDIMGNQRNVYSQQKQGGDAGQKKEDQQRYRQLLDMQREQSRITKMKEEQAYYQPPASQQQYSNNPTRGKVQQQQDLEYDVMGNQRVAYGNSASDNVLRDQKRVDQGKYREMLDVQREQTKMQKQREDDDMGDLERKYNGLNIGVHN